MVIAQYFVEFIFYSFLGWIWESIYCTIKEGKWADRGFLFGPICPIYGSSVVIAAFVFTHVPILEAQSTPVWQIFLISMVGSAIMEYATSFVLEKRFHARWWDYSYMPLNINGRICLPCSIGFGLAGIVVIRYLLPAMIAQHDYVSGWIYEVLAILFAGFLGADLALTEASLTSLLKDIEKMHQEFNERAESTYERIANAKESMEDELKVVKELTEKYARQMSFSEKHALHSIRVFLPGTRAERRAHILTGHEASPGQRLKDALELVEKHKGKKKK